jgi:chromosome segregation ATPase
MSRESLAGSENGKSNADRFEFGIEKALERLQNRRQEIEFEISQWRAISERVRTEVAQVSAENRKLAADNRTLSEEVQRIRAALERTTDENLALKSGLSSARKQLEADRGKMIAYVNALKAAAIKMRAQLVEQLQRMSRAGQTARAQLISANERNQQLLIELDAARKNAQAALQSASAQACELKRVNERVGALAEAHDRAENAKKLAQDEIARFTREYVSIQDARTREREILDQRRRAIEEIHRLQREVHNLRRGAAPSRALDTSPSNS